MIIWWVSYRFSDATNVIMPFPHVSQWDVGVFPHFRVVSITKLGILINLLAVPIPEYSGEVATFAITLGIQRVTQLMSTNPLISLLTSPGLFHEGNSTTGSTFVSWIHQWVLSSSAFPRYPKVLTTDYHETWYDMIPTISQQISGRFSCQFNRKALPPGVTFQPDIGMDWGLVVMWVCLKMYQCIPSTRDGQAQLSQYIS